MFVQGVIVEGFRRGGYARAALVLFRRPGSVQDGVVDTAGQLRGMVNGYQVAQALHVAATLGISDLLADRRRTVTVVDVGGGRGALLAAILARHPHLHGVLFDQPDVVDAPDDLLQRAGTEQRCTRLGGDFFTAVPDSGDAYLLKAVIHDWPDAESMTILRTVRRALPDHGVVLLVEQLLDDWPDPARVAFSDLNMLVAPGGRERTLEQYRVLLAAADLTLTAAIPTGTTTFVLEARPSLP
jgi:hypothetical protein